VRNAYLHFSPNYKYPGHRLDDNIKMAVEEIGCEGMNWIYLAQDCVHWGAVVKTAMNIPVS
jgi:hypothetical protein